MPDLYAKEVEQTDIERMCGEYYQIVLKYLLCITGGDYDLSEELTQETFYRAIRNASKFRGDCKMSTWLCQIAKFSFYQHMDKRKRHNEVSIDEIEGTDRIAEMATESFPEKEFFDNQRKIELYRAIHRQASPYREVLMLRLTGDLSFRDIGEILGKSENWARVTFYRGKKSLAKEMGSIEDV